MLHVRRVLSTCMLFVMLFSGLSVSNLEPALAQDDPAASAGFVSGPWRVVALQTVVSDEIADADLAETDAGVWVAVIADVTNTGVATAFDPATLELGTTADSPLSMTNGVAGDVAASVSASQALQLQGVSPEGAFPVGENGTIRLAVVFQLDDAPADGDSLVLRLNEQVMSISNTVVDEVAVAQLPALVPEMQLQVADITNITGGGKVEVALRTGGTETIELAGVITPMDGSGKGCYVPETAGAIQSLSGGTVWIEKIPGSEEELVWFNNPAAGNFGLLNSELVAQGFGGAADKNLPYTSWLLSIHEYVRQQETGLWAVCRDASGTWINPPTPTPVPSPTPVPTQSPEQVRAQYQWVDTRDLVIRPGEFEGEQIAVAGTVFNIEVDGNFTAMQIWLDGGSEAAVIIYEGDSRGIYQGTWVTVYGTGAGTYEGTNAFGGTISQPVVVADIVDF